MTVRLTVAIAALTGLWFLELIQPGFPETRLLYLGAESSAIGDSALPVEGGSAETSMASNLSLPTTGDSGGSSAARDVGNGIQAGQAYELNAGLDSSGAADPPQSGLRRFFSALIELVSANR
jgi:hypothetical protein